MSLPSPGLCAVFVYYWRTHFPYVHRPRYRAHQPEVPGNFDYTRSNVRDYRQPITNRYLNCLDELDDWLGAVLKTIDLNNTIVVFTGDHGEEFFEEGRLSHCSSLDDPQIRTPMLIHIPGVKPRRLNIITSHADMMPTIADVLGWESLSVLGKSIFEPGPRSAWVAMDNHEHTAKTWAIITTHGRMILRQRLTTRDSEP